MYIVFVYIEEDARNSKRFNKKKTTLYGYGKCNGEQCFHLQTKRYTY